MVSVLYFLNFSFGLSLDILSFRHSFVQVFKKDFDETSAVIAA